MAASPSSEVAPVKTLTTALSTRGLVVLKSGVSMSILRRDRPVLLWNVRLVLREVLLLRTGGVSVKRPVTARRIALGRVAAAIVVVAVVVIVATAAAVAAAGIVVSIVVAVIAVIAIEPFRNIICGLRKSGRSEPLCHFFR